MTFADTEAFYCQECGHKFRTLRAAERASFGPEGCPECGGADIDQGPPSSTAESEYARAERGFADSREP